MTIEIMLCPPKWLLLVSIEKDIRPISLTPIAAKVFESIIMKWVDETIEGEIDAKQFGGISGTSTTDVLVELVHMWYKINLIIMSEL